MSTLLRIDASARTTGSHSRSLADYFLSRWMSTRPGWRVLLRDLARHPAPHLDDATIAAFAGLPGGAPGDRREGLIFSDILIAELKSADHVLISSALYNFNVPSPLKAYVDHIVRWNQTFTADESGYRGLLAGRTATVLTARGGMTAANEPDGLDVQGPFLVSALRFIGFERVALVALEVTNNETGDLSGRVEQARKRVDQLIEELEI